MSATLTRRTLLAGSGAAGLTALLSACSGGSGGEAGQIQFWNNFSDATQVKYFTDHIAQAYPGPGTVTVSNKSSNTIDRLIQTALAAGSGPDVIVTPGPSTGVTEYTKAGYLLDLEPYAKKYGWDTVFAKWALDASRIGGKLMTLPTSYESMVYYVNPATLSKLGLTAPTTLEEFEAFNAEAKAKGVIPIAAGNADWKGANEWHLVIALNHAAGPEAVYSALKGETKWTDPVFVDAISKLAGWFKKGWYGGGVQNYFTNNFPTVYKQLASGQAASMISGTWEFSNLGPYFGKAAGNSADWDWTTIPSLGSTTKNDVFDLAIGQSAGVNAHSKSVKDAASFLNFMTTDKKVLVDAVVEKDFQLPPIQVSAADFGSKADPRTVRLYTQLSAAKSIGYTTWTFFPQQTETYMINYFENVITDKLSVQDYLAGIQQKFDPELKAGKVPTAPAPTGVASS
ncbi:ABC transporter substrate-binding protein [Amnibacterium kyonggiense]|uniref:Carbohydrate ABC transporter substrate-binding protein (CUT1 family) n=1 Tax=Amnibacterium kyonggiense TaxID=595671 RepID=A0A4R7FF94_9MICO|nr:extracellular solute-binding protein [Amnibacterium kyonggiense]TDS74841.1 carbohydrate ABC transporter substrate-binding protein (CUT1 family) [Amnibacterium kyonggiense]